MSISFEHGHRGERSGVNCERGIDNHEFGPEGTDPAKHRSVFKPNSGADAPIVVNYTGPGITTAGRERAIGIMVFLAAAASM